MKLRKRTIQDLTMIGLLALLCATVLAISKNSIVGKGSINKGPFAKKQSATSCSAGETTNKNSSWPKGNGNGCAHQQALGVLFENASKRSKIHAC
jgi:hypothetical protein